MPTPASGSAPYCDNSAIQLRADYRTLAQLLSDSGTPLTQSQVTSSTLLTTILQQASGIVEASAIVGARYKIDPTTTPPRNDLATLTGNSKEMLVGLVADIALWILWNRRPRINPGEKPPGQWEQAQEMLKALRNGEMVFGFVDVQDAGNMYITTESAAVVERRQGISLEASRFFSRRNNRLHG